MKLQKIQRRRPLEVEALEDRTVPAGLVTATLLPDGTLQVTGSPATALAVPDLGKARRQELGWLRRQPGSGVAPRRSPTEHRPAGGRKQAW
jgi:hypothetical protein